MQAEGVAPAATAIDERICGPGGIGYGACAGRVLPHDVGEGL